MLLQTPLSSPRLKMLQQALAAGDRAALETFWQEVRSVGTPLIEAHPDDEGQRLVTFLWQGEAENVVVHGLALPWRPRLNRLRRLPDTNLWYATYAMPADVHFTYRLSPDDPLADFDELTPQQMATWMTVGQTDPLNPQTLAADLADTTRISSIASLPKAPAQPWSTARTEVPHGTVGDFSLTSAHLGNERRLWVYTPPKYVPDGDPYGLLILFDAEVYRSGVSVSTVLDNLIAAGAVPPLVALLTGHPDMPTRIRDLAFDEAFAAFLTDELLPWARERFHISTDPAETIIGGWSLGGLMATFVAFRRPDLFGKVLSQSGSFWWSQDEPELLTRQIADTERQPLQFYLDAGLFEDAAPSPVSLLQSNRHLREVLEAKGYAVQFVERTAGHDHVWWRGGLADGLQALTRV